jgi:hypothetical protein
MGYRVHRMSVENIMLQLCPCSLHSTVHAECCSSADAVSLLQLSSATRRPDPCSYITGVQRFAKFCGVQRLDFEPLNLLHGAGCPMSQCMCAVLCLLGCAHGLGEEGVANAGGPLGTLLLC